MISVVNLSDEIYRPTLFYSYFKGEVTYEKVHAMPYMEMVINEVLRLHPVASL